MDIMLDQKIKQLCIFSGFTSKGKTFFRIVGDGVLQIVKCKHQRSLQRDVIYIGLLSMYDSLQPQWFTASGSIARYSIVNCYHQNNMPLVFAVPIQTQIDMFCSKVLPWLDTIDTQKKLCRAINTLDRRWNDSLKIGPYLACGEVNHAKKVVREILAQHDFSRLQRIQYHEESSGERSLQRDQADTELQCLLEMIDRADVSEIESYLKANYLRNMEHARFCIRSI